MEQKEKCANCVKKCEHCGRTAPVLTGSEIALLRDVGALADVEDSAGNLGPMDPSRLQRQAAEMILARGSGGAVELVGMTVLVRLEGPQSRDDGVDIAELTNVDMTPLERQLLLDRGALHAPTHDDMATITAIVVEVTGDDTALPPDVLVFECELLGPHARQSYIAHIAQSMLDS